MNLKERMFNEKYVTHKIVIFISRGSIAEMTVEEFLIGYDELVEIKKYLPDSFRAVIV